MTIRISNHPLHPNQERVKTINIIADDYGYVINNKRVDIEYIHNAKGYKQSIIEYIELEIALYGGCRKS